MSQFDDQVCSQETVSQPLCLAAQSVQEAVDVVPGMQFETSESSCLIGCADTANWVVENVGLDALHCEVQRNPAGTYIRSFSKELVVNDQVCHEAWLHLGDRVRMEELVFQVEALGQIDLVTSHETVTSLETVTRHETVTPPETAPTTAVSDAAVSETNMPETEAKQDFVPVLPFDPAPVEPTLFQPESESPSAAELLSQLPQELAYENLVSAEPAFTPLEIPAIEAKPLDQPVSEEVASEPVEHLAPVEETAVPVNESVAEMLARLNLEGAIDVGSEFTDESSNATSEPRPAPVPAPVQPSQETLTSSNVEPSQEPAPSSKVEANQESSSSPDCDSSVQDYMKQLMNRLDGSTTEGVPVSVEPAPVEVAPEEPTQDEPEEVSFSSDPINAADYVPRDSAPEKTTTLNALRQVANQSAQCAIDKSTKQRAHDNNVIHLAGMGLSFFISALLFLMSSAWFDFCFFTGIMFSFATVGFGYVFACGDDVRRHVERIRGLLMSYLEKRAPADDGDSEQVVEAVTPTDEINTPV